MTEIAIEKIKNNPYRDMENYALDQEHIERLKDNIGKTGLWKNIEGRRVKGDGFIELAYGHHRVEAARQLGIKTVDVSLSPFTEDEMIDRMVTENTTQRGYSTSALLDSVASITKRLAYLLFSMEYDEAKTFGTFVLKVFPDKTSWGSCKGQLEGGRSLGYSIIHRYNGSLEERAVDQATIQLKDTGKLKEIIEQVRDRITKEKTEAEDARRLANEAADKKRQKEEQTKIDRLKKGEDSANRATSQHQEATVDSKAMQLFPQSHQADAFRKAIKGVPLSKQMAIGEAIIEDWKRWNTEKGGKAKGVKEMSAEAIGEMTGKAKLGNYHAWLEDQRALWKAESRTLEEKANDYLGMIGTALSEARDGLKGLQKLYKQYPDLAIRLPKLKLWNLPSRIDSTINDLKKVKDAIINLIDEGRKS